MSQQELLGYVVRVLDRLEIAYLLSGSLASSLQGEPRATHDIDLVVELTRDMGAQLGKAFPSARFYLSPEHVLEAIQQRSMFNVLDMESGDKIDFWILTKSPFDQARFARRRKVQVLGLDVFVSSPEDTILMKLKWAKDSGGSEKQFRDAVRVYEVQGAELDGDYLEDWADRLSVEDLWRRLTAEAQSL